MVRYERPRVWSAVVFNAEQIDGLAPATNRPALPAWERHERAEAILARFDATVRHARGDRAFYRLADDSITLPERDQFASADGYYATALHEVGHATGHPSRLNRPDLGHPFGSEAYAREELRAEIASLMLGEQLGIGHDPGQHSAYVESWIRALENDPREIFRAAADAEKITALVRVSFERDKREQQADHERASDQPESEQGRGLDADSGVQVRLPVMIQENHPAMTTNDDRTYLAVPYAEKDDAKRAGAEMGSPGEGVGMFLPAWTWKAFTVWLPSRDSVHIAVDASPAEQFAEALRECGLRPDGPVQMDGEMHRVPVEGDKGNERSGAYVGHLDGRPAGFIQNFKTGVKTTWKASGQVAALGAQDRAHMAAEAAQKRHERALERERMYERTAQQVDAIWTAAMPVEAHPYLAEKGVPSHGLRQGVDGQTITVRDREGAEHEISIAGRLLVPVADANGKMMSLQFIEPAAAKMFMPNGRVEGGHYVVGDVGKPGPLLIAEGYATAATLYELTGMPAIVAFNAGNLAPVAQTYRQLHPDRPIYIAGDNDHRREAEGKPNVGRDKAEEAAAAAALRCCRPLPEQDARSDWNDLARGQGRTPHQQLTAGIAIAERKQMVRSHAVSRDDAPSLSHAQALTRSRDRMQEVELER